MSAEATQRQAAIEAARKEAMARKQVTYAAPPPNKKRPK